MSFKKMLVAIDRLNLSETVFEEALELAQTQGASLMVFHCINWQNEGQITPLTGSSIGFDVGSGMGLDPTGGVMEQTLQQERLQQELQQVQGWIDTYGQKAAKLGIATESYYKVGDAGESICEVAQNWGADLIVIGRQGHTALTEMLMGSVSNHVLHHAPCSVLVVQRPKPAAQV